MHCTLIYTFFFLFNNSFFFFKRRLQKELKLLQKEPVPYVISAQPQPNNMLIWHFVIEGPENSPYGYFFFFLIISLKN